jgi:hypothetical protein
MAVTEETMLLAGELYGAYPGRQIGEANILSAAAELSRYESGVAEQAVRDLIATFADPPAVSQIREAARVVLGRRPSVPPELPAIGESPPEESLQAMADALGRWKERDEANPESVAGLRGRLRHMSPSAERTALSRRLARALLEETAEADPELPPMRPALGNMCAGTGKQAMVVNGKWVCPDCETELEDVAAGGGGR